MSRPLESLQKNNLYNKNNQEKAVPLITTMESFQEYTGHKNTGTASLFVKNLFCTRDFISTYCDPISLKK